MRIFLIYLLLMIVISCNKDDVKNENTYTFLENFNSESYLNTHWKNASQNNSPLSYFLENGNLKITTRANSNDRVKIQTRETNFSTGTYIWHVYVPKYNLNEQCSIGAFLYHNDSHEIDFEIGSGTNQLRTELNAQENDMIVYCTSQGFPFSSHLFLIQSESWHKLKLKLSVGTNNNYKIEWFINANLVKTLQTNFSIETTFGVYNSLENLTFMGDFLPTTDNYVLFNSFSFNELNN